MSRFVFILSAGLLLAASVHAHQFAAGDLVIAHPWSRPTAPGMPGVAYLAITNNGPLEEVLLSAHTPAAARVEFHRTVFEGGMARMRPAGTLSIAPGKTLRAEPGGLHLMLVELKSPLVDGTTMPLVLTFKSAGEVTVQIRVELRDQDGAHARH